MRSFLALAALLVLFPVWAHAADAPAAAPAVEIPKQDPADLDQRLALAKKWHDIMPFSVREQVDQAIDEVARTQPQDEQEIFRANMRNVLNYQALEKISVDAMAEIYTVAELQARIEYYSKPEAQSAAKKDDLYAQKVYPEIIRMLDEAMMRARTGGTGQ